MATFLLAHGASYASETFDGFAERARSEAGWRSFEIEAAHSPNVTAPPELMLLLDRVVSSTS